jgi:hypothetical protein
MNEETHYPLPPLPVAPKRKYTRKAKHVAAPKQVDEMDGLTARECCLACNEKRCVITGSNICGHPLKASHPGADRKVMERIAKAKKILAHQKIEAA